MNRASAPPDSPQPRGAAASDTAQRAGAPRAAGSAQSQDDEVLLDEDISVHILTTSAVMLGVCMTVVGVLHVLVVVRNIDTWGDDILSINSMIYLLACLSAYWALRTRRRKRYRTLERAADVLFLFGLLVSTIATGFITWAIAGN